MAEIMLNKDNFENEVLKSDKTVLVDFWAAWCGPCKMLGPVVSEVAEESDGSFKVGKVNVDEEAELASRYQIMSIPTLIVFKNGEPVETSVGFRSKEEILEMLK